MKLILEFEIDEEREYNPDEVAEEMAGALAALEEFEGAGVTCTPTKRRADAQRKG